jgi:dihydroorotate dehydrogenase (NAD+) catalytic subunit
LLDISTKISNLNFRNPTLLASGIMDEDSGSMIRIFNSGAGGVVTKSVGIDTRSGYKNPSLVELEFGILNAMGLPNPGIDLFEKEINKVIKKKIPIICSIFGSNISEFVELAKRVEDVGASAIELNMSCPHAKGYGLEIGSDSSLIYEITSNVKNNVRIPVFVKISSNVTNILEIANKIADAKADGIVAINSVKAMKIDINLKKPVLSNKIGGYSGKAIKPIGIKCVYEIYDSVEIPIIGVGGIVDGNDIVEYLMAGATVVQIGSGVYYRGIDVFEKSCNELKIWMNENGYKNITELIGVAHE